jgi:galactokinase
MDDDAKLIDLFRSEYAKVPRLFSAPGRVNLIGDHTDYNDGFALPIAIGRRTVVAAARRSDRTIHVRSLGIGARAELDLATPGFVRRHAWLDYVEGMARALMSRGLRTEGADLLVASDVPMGAGLSSSAALEMSVGLALVALAGDDRFSARDIALAAQSAEHTYVGTLSGIMDQLVAACGQKDAALLIDCRTLCTTDVPCALPGATIVVCNTNVKRELAASAYNERRRECETSVAALRVRLHDLRSLRDLSLEDLAAHGDVLTEPLRRRCRHVLSENARTLGVVRALGQNDLVELGRLMTASHASLRFDYEVSCPELDHCVEVAAALPGVFGARMTGGGFGGCTVNLVAEGAAGELAATLDHSFAAHFGHRPDVFVVRASNGMKEH